MASNQPHTKRDVGGDKSKSKDEKSKSSPKEQAGSPAKGRQSGRAKT